MKLQNIDEVTLRYGNFRFSDYLSKSGRNYAIFLIDFFQKDIIHSDGLLDDELKENSKAGLNLNSKGIFALYGERQCKSTDKPVEVLMIEKDLWESDDEQLKELLIFHEVCHLLEKTKYHENLEIKLSENDFKVGSKLHEIANRMNEMFGGWGIDENHNQTFGAILFHFLRQYDKDGCYKLLAKSMIKNFGDDYTEIFKQEVEN